MPVTLLITNSIDYVADLLVQRLGPDKVFRYNSDLWRDYRLAVDATGFEVEDPTGRRLAEADVAKVYRRSHMRESTIFPGRPADDAARYAEEEVWMAWSDIVNILWAAGKVVLIQPNSTPRSGKLQQLRIARTYFDVPPWRFLVNRPDRLAADKRSVAKSFTFKFADGIGFYSQLVPEGELDPAEPWFLSDYVEAGADVTVAAVRDALFAFELDRTAFLDQTIDWRRAPSAHAHRGWTPVGLPDGLARKIHAFLGDLGLHYARIDFLRAGNDHVFLEANVTGEWGWLDPDGKHGLLDKIVREIDPETPCVSCPRPNWTRGD